MAGYFDRYDAFGEECDTICGRPAMPFDGRVTDHDVGRQFQANVERALRDEERIEAHRARILTASVGVLKEIIRDAELGFNPSRCVRAASADLMIDQLVTALKSAQSQLVSARLSTADIDLAIRLAESDR